MFTKQSWRERICKIEWRFKIVHFFLIHLNICIVSYSISLSLVTMRSNASVTVKRNEMCSSHKNRELTNRRIATPRYWKQQQMWTGFDRKFAKIYRKNTETFSIKYTKFEVENPLNREPK
jgi:hypothetical protein